MPLSKIGEIMEKQLVDPSKRVAQHALAFEFVELVHGADEASAVSHQHRRLFHQAQHPPAALSEAAHPTTDVANVPKSIRMTLPQSLVYNQSFNKVLLHAGMVSSKSEGHRLLTNGGAYVASPSGERTTFVPIGNDWSSEETEKYVVDGLLVLRIGKWKFKVIDVVSDEEFDKMAGGGQLPAGWEQIKNQRHLDEG